MPLLAVNHPPAVCRIANRRRNRGDSHFDRTHESVTGRRVRGISYPYGGDSAVSPEIFAAAKSCGLEYGFTMKRGIDAAKPDEPLCLKRIDSNDVAPWYERR